MMSHQRWRYLEGQCPGFKEETCAQDALSQNGVIPGLSLAQWMSMQQNPLLGNSGVQPEYLSPIVQNRTSNAISRQLALQAQLLQQNSAQLNAPRLPQHDQQELPKVQVPLNQLGISPLPQQHLQDVSMLRRKQLDNKKISLNQTDIPQTQQLSLLQSILMQPQTVVQNQMLQQKSLSQKQLVIQNDHLNDHSHLHKQVLEQQQPAQPQTQQQQNMCQNQLQQPKEMQQSRMPAQLPNQTNQLQLQLLQKLQQQQMLLSQSFGQLQLPQILDGQIILSESPQNLALLNPPPQQPQTSHQQFGVASVSHISQSFQPLQQQQSAEILSVSPTTVLSNANLLTARGMHLPLTDGAPSSCSASPSTKSCAIICHPVLNRVSQTTIVSNEKTCQSPVKILNPCSLQTLEAIPKLSNAMPISEQDMKSSVSATEQQPLGDSPKVYLNNSSQMDLESTSSVTSACLSQNDGSLHQNLPSQYFNQPLLLRNALPDGVIRGSDPGNDTRFGANIDGSLGIPVNYDSFQSNSIDSGNYHNHLSANAVADCVTLKDVEFQELSSSVVSQPFGVPDIPFSSIDSTINDSNVLNRSSWGPAHPIQQMRTYTKVYKRGAVGRSLDITRYSGYDELKRELTRMFSIEGQLEEQQRIGWKLVYVDHENDVLLVGDDPWEEFVSCVRYIRILSPQEVQQMSLDGDLGNSILSNQSCAAAKDKEATTTNVTVLEILCTQEHAVGATYRASDAPLNVYPSMLRSIVKRLAIITFTHYGSCVPLEKLRDHAVAAAEMLDSTLEEFDINRLPVVFNFHASNGSIVCFHRFDRFISGTDISSHWTDRRGLEERNHC
ncbi:hypothetical protein HPP92_017777 [Vanilla planifolia]|uniref:Auxin-responsive protein n=1 Tax=Vanilla planifolia TaxID=51239 RepID=A0A835QF39_VANPL|nr:hypothetical protein HPP92_017777 [Vanilla planifolia]